MKDSIYMDDIGYGARGPLDKCPTTLFFTAKAVHPMERKKTHFGGPGPLSRLVQFSWQ